MVLAQRFGGALNLNLHFHALVLDGVYTSERPFAPPRFQPARELTDQDVVHVTGLLVRRIVRYLQRRGRLPREEHVELDEPAPDEPLLALISAASIEGRIALGPESGQPLTRRGRQRERRPLFLPGELCCDLEGFSLHAKVAIEGPDRAGLERLCRLPPGYQYRLPTEAEWEYACRAGTTTEFNVGSALFCNQARFGYSYHSNSSCGSSSTVPLESYAPNAWGLYDVHNNVCELCLDSIAAPWAARSAHGRRTPSSVLAPARRPPAARSSG